MKCRTFFRTMAPALLLPLLALVVPSPAPGGMAVALLYLEGNLAYSAWAGIGITLAGVVGLTIGLALRCAHRKSC